MPNGLSILTGGSRGIDAEVCSRLAADGYTIAVNYASDATAIEATAIEKPSGTARAFKADVANPFAASRLFMEAAAELGPLAGLVNSAGSSGRFARVDELTRRS